MEVYRKLSEIPIHDDSIITIGTFDGCHRGHQDIIKKVVYNAKITSCKSVLITFDPHPRHILNSDNKLPIFFAKSFLSTIKSTKPVFSTYSLF